MTIDIPRQQKAIWGQRSRLEDNVFFSVLFDTVRTREGAMGLAVIVVMVTMALAAPVLTPYDPLEIHKGQQFQPPSWEFLFGSDELGRDILSRAIFASRISLLVGALAVAMASLAGVPLGLVSGYFGGITDTVIMRLMDTLLAFPAVLLAMAIVAVMGPGSFNAMVAVAIVRIPGFARIARASMLSQKEQEYVLAARAIGSGDGYIIFRHILPNCTSPILVQIALSLAYAILLEAGLSFLGLGTQPPDASWGAMLYAARDHLRHAWWYGFFPGLFITVLVLGLNSFSEALRDALDPTRRRLK
jgi:ABC-type dipeptide/oligopeptide/nickel transport system permease subunit